MTHHHAPTQSTAKTLDETAFHPVSPKLGTLRLVTRLLYTLLWTGLAAAVTIFMGTSEAPTWLVVLAGLVTLAILIYGIVLVAIARRQVRAIGYALREEDLVIKTGIMFKQVIAIPYGRLQYVEVHEGPLLRWLGLSNLSITTAGVGGGSGIPGLPRAVAEELREFLTAQSKTKLAGL